MTTRWVSSLLHVMQRALTGLLLLAVSLSAGGAAIAQGAHPPAAPWWHLANWIAWFHDSPQNATALLISAIGSGGGLALTVFQVWFSRSALEAEARQIAKIEALEQNVVARLENVQETQRNAALAVLELPTEITKQVLTTLIERGQLLQSALSSRLKPPRSPPSRPTRCIGRSREIERLIACLTSDSTSSSAIVFGGPGLGKSTLVREVMHRPEVTERFGQNIVFVQLEQILNAGVMLGAIAEALNVAESGSIGYMMSSLGRAPSLLVLDNLETVWISDPAACERELGSIAQFSPSTSLVVTYRGAELPATPEWNLLQTISPLTEEIASELFLAIARGISPHDPLLAGFLKELGGIPLAIELVALEAAPFDRLDRVWSRWQKVGTAIAQRRHAEASRTTSLEYSISLSLHSPDRNPQTLDVLSIVATLHKGLDTLVAEKVMQDDLYEGVRDLVGSGLGFLSAERIDLLPPIRRYVLAVFGIREDLVERLVAAYWSLALSIFSSDATDSSAIDAVILGEDLNFQTILAYAASRVEGRAFLDLAQKVIEYYRNSHQRIVLCAPDSLEQPNLVAAYMRFLRGFADPLVYIQNLARRSSDFKSWMRASTLRLECECLIDDLMMPVLYAKLRTMEESLTQCTPEGQREVESILVELRQLYDNYSSEMNFGVRSRRNEGWQLMLNTMTLDDQELMENTREYFETEASSIQLDEDAIQRIRTAAPKTADNSG